METTPVKHRGRYKLKYRGTECLNCGHPMELSDRFCPNCSQANSVKHLTIKDFLDELFEDMVRFDTRLVRTLTTMLWRPGRVSKDFIAGKRKTYANPFRFLLTLAFIYFLLLSVTGDFDRLDRYGKNTSGRIDMIPDLSLDFDPEGSTPGKALANLDSTQLRKLDSLGFKGLDTLTVEGLDSLDLQGLDKLNFKKQIKDKKEVTDSTIMANPRAYLDSIRGDGVIGRTLQKANFFLTLIDKDSVYTYEEAVEKHGLPNRREDEIAFGIADSVDHLNRQPGGFLNEFLSTVPFAIFAFLPFFTIFLWLVYIRKKFNYTDNLVFSFHSQSLFFILLIVSFLIDQILDITSIGWFILIFAVYLYLSMRRFYGQGWFKTTIKYLFLNTIFVILASVAALIFLVGSALTY
ncbi:MAG: DUF3667 domain-containing protein [Flavobacteriaceae bacterium]|nr:MAG: DUF3667 domain-containing protein [Flavobacteriaceae bacterium]